MLPSIHQSITFKSFGDIRDSLLAFLLRRELPPRFREDDEVAPEPEEEEKRRINLISTTHDHRVHGG